MTRSDQGGRDCRRWHGARPAPEVGVRPPLRELQAPACALPWRTRHPPHRPHTSGCRPLGGSRRSDPWQQLPPWAAGNKAPPEMGPYGINQDTTESASSENQRIQRKLAELLSKVFFMEASWWFGLGSGHPVLHVQARHLGKLAGVVGDQRCLLAESVGGDHGVQRANRGAAAFQISP